MRATTNRLSPMIFAAITSIPMNMALDLESTIQVFRRFKLKIISKR